MTESRRRFGQRKPIVLQASTGYVVAGNHLVQAARALHWTEVAANVQEMDDAEATAFMLADNRTSDLGGYDDALLATRGSGVGDRVPARLDWSVAVPR